MNPGSKMDALIFDYDGVLADTERIHYQQWAEILARRGVTLSWEQYCRIGRGFRDTAMFESLRKMGVDPAVLSGASEEKTNCKPMILEMCTRTPPIAAATIDLLRSLACYRIGLVTTATSPEVLPVLRAAGIETLFQATVFGEEVEHHKPAPDPYLLVKRKLGIQRGLVFEDSDAGILSAQRAELDVVRVSDPSRLSELVREAIG